MILCCANQDILPGFCGHQRPSISGQDLMITMLPLGYGRHTEKEAANALRGLFRNVLMSGFSAAAAFADACPPPPPRQFVPFLERCAPSGHSKLCNYNANPTG